MLIKEPSAECAPFNWCNILRVEAPAVRTAVAATAPLIVGQIMGYPTVGLMIGLGGLYTSVNDKPGATLRSMLIASTVAAVSGLMGTVVGNVVWLSILLMFVWAFVGGLLGIYGVVAMNIGFVMTLVFAVTLGMAAPLDVGLDRMVEFWFGGLWCTALTLLLWRILQELPALNNTDNEAVSPETAAPLSQSDATTAGQQKLSGWLQQFAGALTWQCPTFQHALRLGVVSALAVALYKGLHIEHGYWMIITVLVIIKPDLPSTQQRALERLVGSVVGGLLAVLLAATIRDVVILDILLVVLAVLAYSHAPNNYGMYVVFLTPFVVLMINIAMPGYWQIAVVRIYDTFAGGALALAIAYLLRPQTTPLTDA
ncbi:MAG: FUSC family protein [Abitibacteriaceae bacterium]|nr:FUSC family protein [Abditibacteriaceae bacterium]